MFCQPSISTLVAAGGAKIPSTTGGWMWNSMDYNHEMSDEDFLAYVDEIVFQDIPIVESQRPELLPVDLQADVHVKSDATSIAYRRWLKELGLSAGTL